MVDWKKLKEGLAKAGASTSKWANRNINPDIMSGNADRLFAPTIGFGGDSGGNQRRSKSRGGGNQYSGDSIPTIRGIDWQRELFGSGMQPSSPSQHKKKKHHKKGSTITIHLK